MSKTTKTTRAVIPSPDGYGSTPHRTAHYRRSRHEPAFTWKEAHSAGLVSSRTVFDQGSLAAREMIRQNDRSDVPPERWTMGKAMMTALARPYVQQAETVMNAGLTKEVDPRLDRVENLQQGAKAAIDAANSDQGNFTFKETGAAFDVPAAIEQVADDDAVIEDDEAAGLTHHRPAPTWLRVAGAVSPFAESIGLLVWLTWLWNVDVARPFDNLLVWVLTAILVLALTIAIAFTAKSAGTAHNHARQEAADGNRRPAAAHYRQRNVMLAISGALGLLIGTTMVVRGVQSLDQPAGHEVAIITVLSLVAGFALPGLTYAAKATDGSLYSRRRGGLTGWLGQIEEDRQTNLEAAASLLDESTKVEQTVVLESLPQVARATEATVHAAVLPYEWAYVQVGVEEVAPPPRPSVTGTDERGRACIVQSITCGLQHAPALDLQPFQDRWERIKALHEQRDELVAELVLAQAQVLSGVANITQAATSQMIPVGVQRRERGGHG